MFAQATTTVTILRGTADDVYGDPGDNDTVAASGIRASILEQRQTAFTPADNRVLVGRFFTARLPYDTDVLESDRIRDERTGDIYVIDSVTRVASSLVTNDVRLDLRRNTRS